MADLDKLFGTTDARTWALEFIDVLDHDENINPKDLGFLIGWFANAIETGRIAGIEEERQRPILEKIHEVLYQVAGAATAPLLQACPDLIFPSEEVAEAVERAMRDFGIPPREEYRPNVGPASSPNRRSR